MTVSQSFDRKAVLKVFRRQRVIASDGSVTLKDIDKTGSAFPSKFDDGTIGFRIKFNIVKVSGPTPAPNPMSMFIYNLGENSRNLISEQDNLVVLEAGYGNSSEAIFNGNIFKTITRKEGPDYVSHIEASDAIVAFQNGLINQSFQKGVNLQTILDAGISTLKGLGVDKGQVEGVPNKTYNQGIVLTGNPIQQLRQVCEQHNLNFSIQDGKVQILPYNQGNGKPTIFISPDTGLVGIPEIRGISQEPQPDGSVKPKPVICFKVLMNSKLAVAQQVVVESKFVNGLYTILKVTHIGDSFQGEWYSECEAI